MDKDSSGNYAESGARLKTDRSLRQRRLHVKGRGNLLAEGPKNQYTVPTGRVNTRSARHSQRVRRRLEAVRHLGYCDVHCVGASDRRALLQNASNQQAV
ncbi:MAG: hypothetical protein IPK79_01620 [Vampirovibrionales bacterium]|nr:hypothetical protein [Vampirovibrionales bacterium]